MTLIFYSHTSFMHIDISIRLFFFFVNVTYLWKPGGYISNQIFDEW